MEVTAERINNYEASEKEENKKKEPFKIVVSRKEPFLPTQEVVVTTSMDFCKKANALFKAAYQDFYASGFRVLQNGGVSLILFFNIPEGGYDDTLPHAFEPIGKSKNESIVKRLSIITDVSLNPSKTVVMTKDGKDGLTPFLGLPKGKDPQWEKRYRMVQSSANYRSGQLLMAVDYIDSIKVIEEIYGYKDDDNIFGSYSYKIEVVRPLGDPVSSMGGFQNWIINIVRLNEKPLSKASRSAGLFGLADKAGNIPMITDIE